MPRAALPLTHPACLLATWFGAGLLRPAPGTWGSLAALPCAWVIVHFGGIIALATATLVVFALEVNPRRESTYVFSIRL